MDKREDQERELKNRPLHYRLGRLIAGRKIPKALELLNAFIENRLPLFEGQDWVIEERRLAWLYRIEILRENGRLTEALAWACLEVEINPENVAAVALKERLKRDAGLISLGARQSDTQKVKASHALWPGVAGMRELKAMLERDVVLPLQEPEVYFQYRLSLPNGILLYGPPGCGKTFIARKLADVIGFNFKEIKPGDLASIYVHGTQQKIAALFDEARDTAPCLLFLDEIDAMVPKRNGEAVGHHYGSEVNEFLAQLNECGRQNILIVGATNLPNRIDPAVLRPGRLDKKFFVGPPDFEARMELLQIHAHGRPQEKIDWFYCAIFLENYTCAEIEYLVNEAARMALDQRRPIITDDIMNAAKMNTPAHTQEQISGMKDILS